jgi:acyl transferase domain-containing protein
MMSERPESGARAPWSSELLVFAAATRPALAEQVRDFAARVVQPAHLAQPLADEVLPCAAAAEAQTGVHRLALIADSRQECATRLARALEYLDDPQRTRFNLANRVYYAEHDLTPQAVAATTALLFPGFGAWHPTLVADLYTHFQSVRTWVDGLDPPARRAILENPQLFPAAAPAGSQTPATAFAATMGAVLAGDLAMHALLCRGFGLQAGAMVGHSYGENAMLLAAGMVDDYRFVTELVQRLTEAMERAYRSRRADAADGALLAIPAAAYAALDLPPTVQLALDNCPQQVVLYGPRDEIAAIESQMQAQGVAAFRLPALDQPVHTPQFPVTPAALRALYAELAIAAPATVYSCATAAPFPRDAEAVRDLLSAQWHQPVHFRATIDRMAADGFRTFVEVGPGGRLTGFVRDSLLRGAGGQETEILAVASNLESRPHHLPVAFLSGAALCARPCARPAPPGDRPPPSRRGGAGRCAGCRVGATPRNRRACRAAPAAGGARPGAGRHRRAAGCDRRRIPRPGVGLFRPGAGVAAGGGTGRPPGSSTLTCLCRRPWPSMRPPRASWRIICTRCWRRPTVTGKPRATCPQRQTAAIQPPALWRSSAWAAAFPAGSTRPPLSGNSSPPGATPS